jgi:hypothetical protein
MSIAMIRRGGAHGTRINQRELDVHGQCECRRQDVLLFHGNEPSNHFLRDLRECLHLQADVIDDRGPFAECEERRWIGKCCTQVGNVGPAIPIVPRNPVVGLVKRNLRESPPVGRSSRLTQL